MSLSSAIPGRLYVELTSADPEDALKNISQSSIIMWNVLRKSDLCISFSVLPSSYGPLLQICDKHCYSLKILKSRGIYWILKSAAKRKLLLIGFAFFLILLLLLPTRVFFVRVQGNHSIPDNQILAAAKDCGIGFGVSRRAVRSEQAKNRLLSAMPQLQWVGVNTAGSVATISVRERAVEQHKDDKSFSNIIASQDGYLLSVTVKSGNPLCMPGQYVSKGQLLVSGYTDCGIYIQAGPSEAEILAQTSHDLSTIRLRKSWLRGKETARKRKYSFLIGKKRINLWKGSGILDSSCGRIYKEKYATLPGGFRLPVALCVDEYTDYDKQPYVSNETDVQLPMTSFAGEYLREHMVAGTILSEEAIFTCTEDFIKLSGSYTCQEMIGREQHEQIGDEQWQKPQNES